MRRCIYKMRNEWLGYGLVHIGEQVLELRVPKQPLCHEIHLLDATLESHPRLLLSAALHHILREGDSCSEQAGALRFRLFYCDSACL